MKRTSLAGIPAGLFIVFLVAADASAMYNPATGTFLNRDPGPGGPTRVGGIAPNAGARFVQRDPTGQYTDGMSLYQYVRGNPTSYVDPMGLACKCGVQGHVNLLNNGWVIDESAGKAYFNFGIRIRFKQGNGYDPKCCRYIQWIQAKVSLNGKALVTSAGGSPLDGKLHVDAWPYAGDNDTNPIGGIYQDHSDAPTLYVAYDVPGWSGGLGKGDDIDWAVTFKGTVIDTCNGNAVVDSAAQSFKATMKGKFPDLKTSP